MIATRQARAEPLLVAASKALHRCETWTLSEGDMRCYMGCIVLLAAQGMLLGARPMSLWLTA